MDHGFRDENYEWEWLNNLAWDLFQIVFTIFILFAYSPSKLKNKLMFQNELKSHSGSIAQSHIEMEDFK